MAEARRQKLNRPDSRRRSARSPNEPGSPVSPGRRRLKVFNTPAGFHNAYVAAPSRKAALEAWGAGTDLFSAGIAEEVKEPTGKAAKAALERPGEVVREGRGGEKEEKPSPSPESNRQKRSDFARSSPASGRGRKKPKRNPSRAALEKAETALAELEELHAVERAELAREEEKLARKRRALADKQAKARAKAEAKRDAAEQKYRKALAQR